MVGITLKTPFLGTKGLLKKKKKVHSFKKLFPFSILDTKSNHIIIVFDQRWENKMNEIGLISEVYSLLERMLIFYEK